MREKRGYGGGVGKKGSNKKSTNGSKDAGTIEGRKERSDNQTIIKSDKQTIRKTDNCDNRQKGKPR